MNIKCILKEGLSKRLLNAYPTCSVQNYFTLLLFFFLLIPTWNCNKSFVLYDDEENLSHIEEHSVDYDTVSYLPIDRNDVPQREYEILWIDTLSATNCEIMLFERLKDIYIVSAHENKYNVPLYAIEEPEVSFMARVDYHLDRIDFFTNFTLSHLRMNSQDYCGDVGKDFFLSILGEPSQIVIGSVTLNETWFYYMKNRDRTGPCFHFFDNSESNIFLSSYAEHCLFLKIKFSSGNKLLSIIVEGI